MTREIEARGIVPGMRIKWKYEIGGVATVSELEVDDVVHGGGDVIVQAVGGGCRFLARARPVTVLKEPVPEEPLAFGALVSTSEGRYIRTSVGKMDSAMHFPWAPEHMSGDPGWPSHKTWEMLIEDPEFKIIDPDPLANVDNKAPGFIADGQWPDDDKHLREYAWEDCDGDTWFYRQSDGRWDYKEGSGKGYNRPFGGPWRSIHGPVI